jgi:DNA-binding protein H-NS
MDLKALSIPELKDLLNQIPKEIQRRQKDEKVALLKELEAQAAARGFSLDELVGGEGKKTRKGTVAVKYRHPQNAELTWTGRGRKPGWVAEFLNGGGKLEQLAV